MASDAEQVGLWGHRTAALRSFQDANVNVVPEVLDIGDVDPFPRQEPAEGGFVREDFPAEPILKRLIHGITLPAGIAVAQSHLSSGDFQGNRANWIGGFAPANRHH